MFDVFLDYVKKLLKSRLFPITLIYLALFGIVINRLFVLQIVEGPQIVQKNDAKYVKNREIKSTRGNFYDRNGELLASNVLSYSVMMEDITTSNEEYNSIIHNLITIIEKNGDTLDNEFYITLNEEGQFEFTVKDAALTRFKKNVYAYVLDDNGNLKEEQKEATAEEVYHFLRNGTGNNYTRMFGISDDYSVEETLKIMGVRYALFCNYPKYLQITVASEVSDATVAAIMENREELKGVEISQQTSRVYEDSLYFAHIIGYTGLISADELEANEDNGYNSTDVIGKTGLEKTFENELAGKKGVETVSVNNSGKVIEVVDSTDPVAGNDIYLTIDKELQKNTYHLLEREITKILLSKIVPDLNYGSKGESASEILIPIYEVYYALINNNIIDIDHFKEAKEGTQEKMTYYKFLDAQDSIFAQLDELLATDSTTTNNNAGDMEDFLDYFYKVLSTNNILIKDKIETKSSSYEDYVNDKISLSKFLQDALANNWVNLSILGIDEEYYSAEELYAKLISYTKKLLKDDDEFNKKIYRNLVFSYKLSGTEICLLLFEQGVLEYNEGDINRLKNNNISAYSFIRNKISSLEITPGMLALEPCSGSVVITDVETGEVRALVTYPSYDNNLLANKVDSDYYAQLLSDKSTPMNNRPMTERTAPGSTYKMITAITALEEGVTTPTKKIKDLGEFTKIDRPAKCHIFPGSHGSVNIVEALKVSCNYYFYEMGWLLSLDGAGRNINQQGLTTLEKYASLFGLNEKSGIELYEAEPKISDEDAVRSSIGQGTNAFTPVQIARYVTTIANRGTSYELTLLDKIKDKDGKTTLDNSATISNKLTDISESTWDSVFEGMYSVVNEYGGSVYNAYRNFGVTVAGKTGTAQISKSKPNHALFVSFAPYEEPEIAVTAVIPNGYTSSNAAALTKDIYSLYFNLEDADALIDSNVTDASSSTNNGAAVE